MFQISKKFKNIQYQTIIITFSFSLENEKLKIKKPNYSRDDAKEAGHLMLKSSTSTTNNQSIKLAEGRALLYFIENGETSN